MSKRNIIGWVLLITLSATVFVGCGDSPELKLQQAKIALANSKPDQALGLVSSVLKDQPDNLDALWVKSRAEMLLAKLSESKQTLDKMLKMHPDDPKVRRAMVDWSWLRLRNLLIQSDFSSNEKVRARFDKALETGMSQAKWLEENGEIAESGYFRARYMQLDSVRYKLLLDDKQRSLSGASIGLDEEIREETDLERQRLERLMNDRLDEAEEQLRDVLDADPNHFKACEMYLELLVQNEHWVDMWELAQQYPADEPIPDTTAEGIVTALVRMPNSIQPLDRRVELGWKVQSAVRDSDKESATWETTSSRLHIISREFSEAKPLLESALKKRPADLDAQYFLAQAHFNLDEFDEALEILSKLRKRASRSSRVQTLYGLAMMKTGNMILAKEALRLATDLNPRDAMAREGFLALMAQEGHITEARGDVDAYYSLNPNDPRAIRFKMQFELANARQDEVLKLMKNVEKLVPLLDEHLAILVDGYMSLQKFEIAQGFGEKLVRNQPESLRSHLKLAESILMQGKDDEVKNSLEELRKQFPESASVDQMLGKLYLQRQSYDKSIELFERVLVNEPTNNTARVLLAQAYASLVLTDEAMEQIDVVLEQNPHDMRAHALAARIFQFTGQVEKANEHLDQIDETRIDERTNPTLLAQLMLKKKKVDEALSICNRAVASGNTDPVLRLLLAAIYRLKEDPEQVETHLLALVHQQPRNPQAFALLTRFYQEQKQIKKGLLEYQELLQLNEPLARLSQATLLAGVGQYEAAVLKLEPIYEPLIRKRDQASMVIADALARLYEKQADIKSAIAIYQQMVDADFMTGAARLRQIEFESASLPKEKVVEMLDEIAETLSPDSRRLGYRVMQRYAKFGRPDKALAVVQDWIDQRPDQSMLRRWQGELLLETGKAPEAIEAYKIAVKLSPESVGMRLRLAKSYVRNFDYAGAEKVFREAMELDEGARITATAALGDMFVQLGLYEEAAKTFEELDRLARPRDPRVLYTMGRALVAMNRDTEAYRRFEGIPKYTNQYATAQITMAQIEQRQGNNDQARQRLQLLTKNRRYAPLAMRELLDSKWRDHTEDDLLRWSDRAVNLKDLPADMRFNWLGVRVRLAANDRDWATVLETMEKMSDLQPESLQLIAGRVLVLRQLTRIDSARDLFKSTPGLARSWVGPLLATAIGLEAEKTKSHALTGFLLAMAQGDLEAAREAAGKLPPYKTNFKSDLIDVTKRSDAAGREMAEAAAELGAALIATEFCGLPQLAEVLCNRIAKRMPSLTPAHSIGVTSILRQGQPVEAMLRFANRALPNSSLALYLKAREAGSAENYIEGADYVRKILERNPDNIHMRYYLSQLLQLGGDVSGCIKVLEEIRSDEKDAYYTLASNDLAYILSENDPDRLEEAKAIAIEANKAAPRMTVILDTLAWTEHLMGENEQALLHLNQAVVGLSGLAEVHYHLGAVYNSLGNKQWSLYHLQQATSGESDDKIKAKAGQLIDNIKSGS